MRKCTDTLQTINWTDINKDVTFEDEFYDRK